MAGTRKQVLGIGSLAAAAAFVAACAGAQQPAHIAGGGEAEGKAVCAAALIDTSVSPPRHFPIPPVSARGGDTEAIKSVLLAAAPDPSVSIPYSCGVVRFGVSAAGKVTDPVVLAEFPRGIGLGGALLRFMAAKVYPEKSAGGPYAWAIVVKLRKQGDFPHFFILENAIR